MAFDELVDYLGWQVEPNIKYSIFFDVFERLLQPLLNLRYKLLSALKIVEVPLIISAGCSLLAVAAIS